MTDMIEGDKTYTKQFNNVQVNTFIHRLSITLLQLLITKARDTVHSKINS